MLELMTSKWSEACLFAVVFDNIAHSKTEGDRRSLRARVVSLFSLLHATALCQLRDGEDALEVLEGVDREGVDYMLDPGVLSNAQEPTFLVYTWIQDMLIKRQDNGGIPVPPPIATRLFQEISQGFLGFNNASKIHNTPFPFPYAQLIQLQLIVLTYTFPFVVNVFVESAFFGAVFSFLAVAGYFSINEVAIQLEDPFGDDANDLPMVNYQRLFNNRIRPLLHLDEGPYRTPALTLAHAAMCCVYSEKGETPLTPRVVEQSYDNYVDDLESAVENGESRPPRRASSGINAGFQMPSAMPQEDQVSSIMDVSEPWKLKFVHCDNRAAKQGPSSFFPYDVS